MSQFLPRIVTHAEIAKVADGAAFYLEDGAELTPLASERARARGIQIHRGSAPAPSTPEVLEAARRVLEQMGPIAPDSVERIVSEVVASLSERSGPALSGLPPSADYCATYLAAERRRAHHRAVLTASGRNQKGIVAGMATIVAELGGDILDISQTIVGDYFTLLLIVDTSDMNTTFESFKDALTQAAKQRGVQAILMHEDLVASMHRV